VHLHQHAIVHCDVKPENLFVKEDGGVAVLGDFDVSVDEKARTTTLATVGGTLDYLAPEVLRNQAATPKSDVFSLGLTLFDCFFNGGEIKRPSAIQILAGAKVDVPEKEHLSPLLRRMLSVDPGERPTALEALTSPFFALPQPDPVPPEKRECVICLEEEELSGGLECGAPGESHFACGVCLEAFVSSQNSQEPGLVEARDAEVRCPAHLCGRALSPDLLALRLTPETFAGYLGQRVSLAERRTGMEKDREWEARLARELEREREQSLEGRVARLRLQAVDEILTLRCPRCSQAFVDYDACAALTCSRCHCGFCALCQTDCGENAHRHVANCPDGVRSASVPWAQFVEIQRARRARKVREFLGRLESEELRSAVGRALARDLEDLGIGM
jgi:hypothetical protein